MIPGFPMDGGRVLRAVIWQVTGNADRATRIAVFTGQLIGFSFILLGLIGFFRGAGLGGLWIAFIGWFVLMAARASYARTDAGELLRGVPTSEMMVRDQPVIPGRSNLKSFVEKQLLPLDRRCFLVVDDEVVRGLITPREVGAVEPERWPRTTVAEVMVPLERVRVVRPDTAASEAWALIERENLNHLPVMLNGRLHGVVARDGLLGFAVTRRETTM
jgi:CBS domain-containing protein